MSESEIEKVVAKMQEIQDIQSSEYLFYYRQYLHLLSLASPECRKKYEQIFAKSMTRVSALSSSSSVLFNKKIA